MFWFASFTSSSVGPQSHLRCVILQQARKTRVFESGAKTAPKA